MNIQGHSFDDSNNNCYSCSSPDTSSSNAPNEEVFLLASARPKKRAGRRVFKETRHPVYRGVRRRNNNRWVCEVRVPNDKSTRIWLGTYATPEMAARAHDVAALALRGKSACLNFADSAWRLALPASTNAKEIRRAAAAAALACAAESEGSSDDASVSEDASDKILKGLDVAELPRVTAYEDVHDWFRSMADEPLRSPPPFASTEWWNYVENYADVSLWSFTT